MIAIVKYNAGNIGSVTNALNRLGVNNMVTDDPAKLKMAEKVVFPGVGEASSAMRYLRDRGLDHVIKNLTQPVLGICLGMQLMCAHSEEGDAECLGIFDTTVKRFPASPGIKVPHMGWNSLGLIRTRKHPTFESYQDDFGTQNSHPPKGGQGGQLPAFNQKIPKRATFHTANPITYQHTRELARENRLKLTETERILWSQLKGSQRNTRFLKQHVIDSFIVDFVSLERKLIIEIDGQIHQFQKSADEQREQALSSLGYEILRFTDSEVKNQLSNCLNKIDSVLVSNLEFKNTDSRPASPLEEEKFRKSTLLRGLTNSTDLYYVHSYYAVPNKNAIAVCDYITPFASVMQIDNFYATQFHPEKSAAVGERILKNFIEL